MFTKDLTFSAKLSLILTARIVLHTPDLASTNSILLSVLTFKYVCSHLPIFYTVCASQRPFSAPMRLSRPAVRPLRTALCIMQISAPCFFHRQTALLPRERPWPPPENALYRARNSPCAFRGLRAALLARPFPAPSFRSTSPLPVRRLSCLFLSSPDMGSLRAALLMPFPQHVRPWSPAFSCSPRNRPFLRRAPFPACPPYNRPCGVLRCRQTRQCAG